MNAATAEPPVLVRSGGLALCLAALLLGACRSAPDMPAFDTAGPRWQWFAGQAVWTPGRRAEPMAGDLLVSRHPDGRVLLDLSKAGMPVARLRLSRDAWLLEIQAGRQRRGGTGTPPARSALLVLGRHLAGEHCPAPWTITTTAPGIVLVSNPSSGESLEVHLPHNATPLNPP